MVHDGDRMVRRTEDVGNLYDPTATKAYVRYQRLKQIAREADQKASRALDAIPRIDPKLYETLAQTGTGEDD